MLLCLENNVVVFMSNEKAPMLITVHKYIIRQIE